MRGRIEVQTDEEIRFVPIGDGCALFERDKDIPRPGHDNLHPKLFLNHSLESEADIQDHILLSDARRSYGTRIPAPMARVDDDGLDDVVEWRQGR